MKPKLQASLNCSYEVHFEALDGVQPKIAETVEEID
jgi:hypothetical protein